MKLTEILAIGVMAGGLAGCVSPSPAHAQERPAAEASENPGKETERYSLEWYKQNFNTIESMRSELRTHPTGEGYEHLSDLMFESGSTKDDIRQVLESAVDKFDANTGLYNNLGLIYALQAQEEENENLKKELKRKAERNYLTALSLDENNYSVLINYGLLLADEGNHKRALDQFGRAIGIHPERWSAYNARARSKYALHDQQGALADFEAALARDIPDRDIRKSVVDWIAYLKSK